MVDVKSMTDYSKLEQSSPGLSMIRIYFLLLKSMVNTGILYQSKPFFLGGVVYSSLALILVGYLTLVCMIWLSRAHDKVGGTYSEITGKAIGKYGKYLVDLMIFLSQFFPAAINIGFIIDLLIRALNIYSLQVSQYALATYILCLITPISLIKLIKNQFWIHLIADLIVFISIMTIITYSIVFERTPHMTIMSPEYSIYALATIIYGFEGIPLLLPVKEAMQDSSKFNKILTYTIITLIAVFLLFCNVSVFAFGKSLEDIVILNLPNKPWVGLLLVGYSLAVAFSMPLVLNPVFTITEKYLKIKGTLIYGNRFVTIILVSLIGLFARNYLGIFVAIDGGVLASSLSFIFPALINLKINAESHHDRVVSYIMLSVGIVFEIGSALDSFFFKAS